MGDKALTRRRFLALTGSSITATTLLGNSKQAHANLPESKERVQHSYQSLTQAQAVTLAAICRTLFPHDLLPDHYYFKIVEVIDGDMGKNKDTAKLVSKGINKLGGEFLVSNQDGREEKLKKIEGSDFFNYMHKATVSNLYSSTEVWDMFGYEGSSFEFGGYINRGFDDISWLPPQVDKA